MAAAAQKKSSKKKKNIRNKIKIKRVVRSLNWQEFKTKKLDQNAGQSIENLTIQKKLNVSKPKASSEQRLFVNKKTKVKLKKLSKTKNLNSSTLKCEGEGLTNENGAHCAQSEPVVSTSSMPPMQKASPLTVQYNIPVTNKFEGIDTMNENLLKNQYQKDNVLPRQYPNKLAVTGYDFFMQPGIVSLGGVSPKITQDPCVAMDCEMVGIGSGREHMLARVSLVNMSGQCIYDTFVYPQAPIVDYRTFVSGIRPENVNQGANFHLVRRVVATLLSNRLLVGHSLSNDLKVLFFKYPKRYTRDTANYKPFRKLLKIQGTPSLKRLAKDILNIDIQGSEHSSIEDARAAMSLYVHHREQWEKLLREEKTKHNKR